MSYEVRLRRIVGGRLMVAVCLDGHVLAETQLDQTPKTVEVMGEVLGQTMNMPRSPMFNIGDLPLDIPLKNLAPASVGMTVGEALARPRKPRDVT